MPRRTIAYLDTPTLDGRVIRVLGWPVADAVPLRVLTSESPIVLGSARDFAYHERDLHHPPRVTAWLDVTIAGLGPEVDLATTGDPGVDPEGRLVFQNARLTAVTLGARPAWEGMIE